MKRTSSVALGALFALVLLPASGQDAKKTTTPAEVEKSARKRAEGWLRDRGPERLGCKDCGGSGRVAYNTCGTCSGRGVNTLKLDDAFWKYLRPSYRRGKKQEEWIAEHLRASNTYERARWSGIDLVVRGGVGVDSVIVSRDVVHISLAKPEERADDGIRIYGTGARGGDMWAREGGAFYIDMGSGGPASEPGEQLVQHAWFTLETFSVSAFSREVERLRAPEGEERLTEIERTRRATERSAAEGALRARSIADLGVLVDARATRDGAYEVTVRTAAMQSVKVTVQPPLDPAARQAFDASLARQGSRIFFRGPPTQWALAREVVGFDRLEISAGEVEVER